MGWAAVHAQEDDAFGPRGKVRRFRGQRAAQQARGSFLGGCLLRQAGKGKVPEAGSERFERGASRDTRRRTITRISTCHERFLIEISKFGGRQQRLATARQKLALPFFVVR